MKTSKITADAVIIENGKILLIKRKGEPFKGGWALPGGHVEYGERVEDAMVREAKEETGLDVEPDKIVGVYSDPERDPRGHYITIAYLVRIKRGKTKAGDDAAETWWWPLDDLPEMAFDHGNIIQDAKNVLE